MTNKNERRCMAFWRNTEYTLDHLLEELKSRKSDKWVTEEDALCISQLIINVKEALAYTRSRYSQVLFMASLSWNKDENVEQGTEKELF